MPFSNYAVGVTDGEQHALVRGEFSTNASSVSFQRPFGGCERITHFHGLGKETINRGFVGVFEDGRRIPLSLLPFRREAGAQAK